MAMDGTTEPEKDALTITFTKNCPGTGDLNDTAVAEQGDTKTFAASVARQLVADGFATFVYCPSGGTAGAGPTRGSATAEVQVG